MTGLKHPLIGYLGLAFKEDMDDLQELPSVGIARQLIKENVGEIIISEPNLSIHNEFNLLTNEEVIARSDIVLLLVDHREFRDLKETNFKKIILIDNRDVIA